MKIVFISDTHRFHDKLDIPKCDVLVCSGDIGGRTNLQELNEFLIWFEKQPADKKIFCAGNHDIVLDKDWVEKQREGSIQRIMDEQAHNDALNLIKKFDVIYLENESYVYNGIKFYGSPISPSFYREYWAFNADRGDEINEYWKMIDEDTDVLFTHGPCYGILDKVKYDKKHVGCKELLARINELNIICHVSGHIHEAYGYEEVYGVHYFNASVLNEKYQVANKPFLVEIKEDKTIEILDF